MTTIKNSFILFTLIVLGCFVAVSCTDKAVNQAEVNETINIQEFQQTLNSVFTEATKHIDSSPYITRNTISSSIKEAYQDVLDDHANMSQFEQASKLVSAGNTNESDGLVYVKTETLSETIIRSAESPADAVHHFDEYLSDENLSDEDRIELIVGKEFVSFLASNSEAIDKSLHQNLMARSGDGDQEEEQDTDIEEDEEGWWESWGKCTAGTIGTSGAGALVGCGIAAAKTVGIGCPIGAVAGAVFGALKGAADYC